MLLQPSQLQQITAMQRSKQQWPISDGEVQMVVYHHGRVTVG